MTLSDTNPPPLATPVIGYAGAEAIQLDLRALARIRLGTGFLIAGLAGSFVLLILPFTAAILPVTRYTAQVLVAAGFALSIAAAACLLAANTGLHSDRQVVRRLLVAAAITLAVTTVVSALAVCLIFTGSTPIPSKPWILTLMATFNSIAYGTAISLCFFRLAKLARHFGVRSIAIQCTVAAAMFLALQAFYLSFFFLIRYASMDVIKPLSQALALFRPALSLWAIIFLAFLLPRLKPTPA